MISFANIEQAYEVVRPVVHKTPVLSSRTYNTISGNEVYFKAENFQRVGAFKIRGAYNKIVSLSDAERKRGVIAHSSGNHAQGVALACKLLGIKALIVMPLDSLPNKVEATKSYGAEVVFTGPSSDDRERSTQEVIAQRGFTFVPPYDDDHVIAGQGTVALEIFSELKELDYLFVDLPPGTGDVHLTLVQTVSVTGAVIVSTPQDVGLMISMKTLRMFQQTNVRLLGIVENMSYHLCSHCGSREEIFGHGGAKSASEKLEIPFLGEIPLDTAIRVKSDEGTPIVIADKDCAAAKNYREIARKLAAQVSIANFSDSKLEIVEEPV